MQSFKPVFHGMAAAAALVCSCAQAGMPQFKVEAFASYETYGLTNALDLNNRGEVVGYSDFADTGRFPFLYRNGQIEKLSQFGMPAQFNALNDRGDLAGQLLLGDALSAAIYRRDGRVVNLAAGLDRGRSEAYAINQAGHAVGVYRSFEENIDHPFFYDGQKTQVLPIERQPFVALNDRDVLLSNAGLIYDHGFSTQIPTASDSYSILNTYAINNAGQVVGDNATPDAGRFVPVVYRDGVTTELPSLGGREARALDINDRGWIVGFSNTAQDPRDYEAFLNVGGQTRNLEDLLVPGQRGQWEFLWSTDINDRGQILVRLGTIPSRGLQYAILTPVPEGQTWALMLAGLGVVGAVLTRRQRA